MMAHSAPDGLLWPQYLGPEDLARIEAIPLDERGLPATTFAAVTRAAELWPDRLALQVMPEGSRYRDVSTRTFGQLLAGVTRVANALHARGVERRDAVAVLAPNCLELIEATLGAQAAGIVMPVNPALGPDRVGGLIAASGARTLIAAGPELHPEVWAGARSVARSLGLKHLLALRPTGAAGGGPALESLEGTEVAYLHDVAGVSRSDRLAGFSPPAADDLAAYFHTGGTTGMPKLAAQTHRNEVFDAWCVAIDSRLGQDSVLFAGLPLFHVNALMVTLLSPLLRGQTVVWGGPLGFRDPGLYASFWQIVERYAITTTSAVPTVYGTLSTIPVDADVTSMKFAIVGAAPLPTIIRSTFEKHTGVPLVQGYGLTEATCASVRGFVGDGRSDAVGQRMPYQNLRAVRANDDGSVEDVALGEVGTMLISGPAVFAGYLSEVTEDGPVLGFRGAMVDGWLDTGDLCRLDEDGYVTLAGRAKDVIIRGGHNIDPTVIEEAMLSHPDVTGAGAVGQPNAHSGEVPVAYVSIRPGAEVPAEELMSWAKAHIGERAAIPAEMFVIEAIPVTDIGKPFKVALRIDATRKAAEQALAAVQIQLAPGDLVVEQLGGAIVATVGGTSALNRESAIDEALTTAGIGWRRAR